MESLKTVWHKHSELFKGCEDEKIVFIFRHSKADKDLVDIIDFDRPLSKKGLKDAENAGKVLRKYGVSPDIIIASAAKRTSQTASLIAKGVKYPEDAVKLQEDLYLADSGHMFDTIRALPNEYKKVVLIAHNPGVSTLVAKLTGADFGDLPTTGMVGIRCKCSKWIDLKEKNSQVLIYFFPKLMKCFE